MISEKESIMHYLTCVQKDRYPDTCIYDMYIYICIHVHTHMYIYIYVYIEMSVHTYTYLYTRIATCA